VNGRTGLISLNLFFAKGVGRKRRRLARPPEATLKGRLIIGHQARRPETLEDMKV
jgi:hypothetical protein